MAECMPALAKNTTGCQLEDELGTKRSQTEMTGSSEKKNSSPKTSALSCIALVDIHLHLRSLV